jgi:hypothetical protein
MAMDFCMPRLLRDWALARTTGTLTVTAPEPSDAVCTVLVEEGSVVFATRRSRRDPTGELFLEIFQVPAYDGEDADEVDIIRSQIMRVITDLFNWKSADVRFRGDIGLTRWPSLDLPLADLMRCGMLGISETDRVRSWLGSTQRRFVRSDDPFGMFLLPLDENEEAVLAHIDTPRTVDELVETCGVTEELVIRLLVQFQAGCC